MFRKYNYETFSISQIDRKREGKKITIVELLRYTKVKNMNEPFQLLTVFDLINSNILDSNSPSNASIATKSAGRCRELLLSYVIHTLSALNANYLYYLITIIFFRN